MNILKSGTLICLLCLFGCRMYAQHFGDERWPMGYSNASGNGNAWIYFQDDQIFLDTVDLKMNFESTVGVAIDVSGKVLFYSNGCEIRRGDGQLMENGSGLNPGMLHDWVCGTAGYSVPRGMMALPVPGSEQARWLLLHLGGSYDPVQKTMYGPLYYTEIDMSANGGLGTVVSKNNVLLTGQLEPFAVVRHGNGRDWWVVTPEYNSNTYHVWLLGTSGLTPASVQQLGASIGCRRIGSSVFSPDGSRYARTNNCASVVLDFDRCDGQFSKPLYLERDQGTMGGGGLAFSDNNRWLYATSQLCIFRADLTQDTPFFDSLFKQPYYVDETVYVSGTSLAYMQQAPNGEVLMSAQHRERYLPGLLLYNDTFEYEQKMLELPVSNIRTLPHFPNYRLFDLPGSSCDTLGINPATEAWIGDTPKIWPNPAQDILYLDLTLPAHVTRVQLFDLLGRVWYDGSQWTSSISVNHAPEGVYHLVVQQGTGGLFSDRVVVQR